MPALWNSWAATAWQQRIIEGSIIIKNAFKSATKHANLHYIHPSLYPLSSSSPPSPSSQSSNHKMFHQLSFMRTIDVCSPRGPFGIFLWFIFSLPSSPPFIPNPYPVLPPQAMDQSRSSMLKGLSHPRVHGRGHHSCSEVGRMFYDMELLYSHGTAVVFVSLPLQLSISRWVFPGTFDLILPTGSQRSVHVLCPLWPVIALLWGAIVLRTAFPASWCSHPPCRATW